MITQYALGASYPPTPLESIPVSPPMRSVPDQYPVTFPRGDATEAGHGTPATVWIFQVLTQEEVNALAAIYTVSGVLRKSRVLYIRTRTPEAHDTYADYTAVGIWPQRIADYRQVNGLYYDVPFEFRRLESYP